MRRQVSKWGQVWADTLPHNSQHLTQHTHSRYSGKAHGFSRLEQSLEMFWLHPLSWENPHNFTEDHPSLRFIVLSHKTTVTFGDKRLSSSGICQNLPLCPFHQSYSPSATCSHDFVLHAAGLYLKTTRSHPPPHTPRPLTEHLEFNHNSRLEGFWI